MAHTMRSGSMAALVVAILAICACAPVDDPLTSTLIRDAMLIDGSGSPAVAGSLRIDGDRIVGVGALEALPGETIVDARGMVLAPGFIDSHSHHDGRMQDFRHMPAVLSQGITTIVRGADGSSGVDRSSERYSQASFNAAFLENPPAVNVASFSAHGDIRYFVMGDDYRREASVDEIEAMRQLVEADMKNGALGLSTGLEYEPGIYSSTSEVVELAKVSAKYAGGYMSHLRDEDDRFLDALDEIIQIGREAQLPVQVSHIKLTDRKFWGTTDKVIERLEAARQEGIEISADIYPYLRWQANLAILFPDRDFTNAAAAEFTFERTSKAEDLVLARFPPNPEFAGMTIAEIAGITESDPVDTLLELTQAAAAYRRDTGKSGSSIIAKGMDENDVVALMNWRYSNICSDGGHGGGHPRGYGAFPRVLGRYVRDLGLIELEDAIFKMTGRAADAMRIRHRGRLQEGNYADLVLFDPDTIEDRATMDDRTAASVGVISVWVNGDLAYSDGEPTGVFPGRLVTLAD